MIDWKSIKKVLTFFAHPDDETLAAGGTLAKLSRLGTEVHVVIPATGIHSRRNRQNKVFRVADLTRLRKDCQKALSILGIEPNRIYLGEFPDNEMDKCTRLELIHFLEEFIEEIKPSLIITHHRFCTNIDHQYCHEAAVIGTRPGLSSHMAVICGEVPSSTGYLKPVQFDPNFYVEIAETDLERKIKAMERFKGEARPDPHPRSGEVLRAIAKVRGSESGCYYAEAFMIQKIFG
jgi:N-acetylglucosamine malate deacetylase 1